jgi:hypothetical protein
MVWIWSIPPKSSSVEGVAPLAGSTIERKLDPDDSDLISALIP